MRRKEFEEVVRQAWTRIPGRFRSRIRNVAIVVEDEPAAGHLRGARVGPGHTLLGLYQGVPLTQRGFSYGMVLPDKITLFQGPIERAAGGRARIPEIVYETLWHEIAHYFGMSEPQVRASEQQRRGR
jgi:predicted Zn-dependent protease with MMP-like domain